MGEWVKVGGGNTQYDVGVHVKDVTASNPHNVFVTLFGPITESGRIDGRINRCAKPCTTFAVHSCGNEPTCDARDTYVLDAGNSALLSIKGVRISLT